MKRRSLDADLAPVAGYVPETWHILGTGLCIWKYGVDAWDISTLSAAGIGPHLVGDVPDLDWAGVIHTTGIDLFGYSTKEAALAAVHNMMTRQ